MYYILVVLLLLVLGISQDITGDEILDRHVGVDILRGHQGELDISSHIRYVIPLVLVDGERAYIYYAYYYYYLYY